MKNVDNGAVTARFWLLGSLPVLFLLLLLMRLWSVQVRHGHDHVEAIKRQSIRRIRLAPIRGRIYSRDGEILVDNRAVYNLVFHLAEMRQPGPQSRVRTTDYILEHSYFLAKLLKRPMPLTRKNLQDHITYTPAVPLVVFHDLDEEDLALVEEQLPRLPGMDISVHGKRSYPHSATGTHVLGFTLPRRPDNTYNRRKYSYIGAELTGINGLERRYNDELSGQPGSKLVRVDTLGYAHEQIAAPRLPQDGLELYLTLDLQAQQIADRLLRGHQGALVLVDVNSGAVLAMSSAPAFDLARFSQSLYLNLLQDEKRRPLVNRALTAGYTPGSIVKPLVALAALNSHLIDGSEMYNCVGTYALGQGIRCWRRSGHGELALTEALEQSCNPFFIDLGLRAGLQNLQPIFATAGFGRRPGIDLPSAGRGLLPGAPSHTGAAFQWYRADTAFVSIGQGKISMSPLQAALYTAAIANGGILYRPYLVQSIRTVNGTVCRHTAPAVIHRLPVANEHLHMVQEGMRQAVVGMEGTAKAVAHPQFALAAKTGTAEVIKDGKKLKDTWAICFGPFENPQYALAILIENGESGGRTAAPLAGRFFQEWITIDNSSSPQT